MVGNIKNLENSKISGRKYLLFPCFIKMLTQQKINNNKHGRKDAKHLRLNLHDMHRGLFLQMYKTLPRLEPTCFGLRNMQSIPLGHYGFRFSKILGYFQSDIYSRYE